MKSAVFVDYGKPLVIEDVADPEPQPDEVIVSVGRCGVCGSDLHITEADPDSLFQNSVPAGTILGHEFAGSVVSVGRDVRHLRVGDLISPLAAMGCGRCNHCQSGHPFWCSSVSFLGGGYSELAAVREDVCIKLPSSFSLEDGALIEPMACGLHAVRRANLKPNDKVLVIGAGPIGLATIFWAGQFQAGSILAMAKSQTRQKLALTMGASDFCVSQENQSKEVIDRLGGAPDIVFECGGYTGLVAKSIEHVRTRGTIVVAGICTHLDPVPHLPAVLKELDVRYAVGYSLQEFQEVADMFEAGKHPQPHSMITDTVSLGDFPAMFESLRSRSQNCKVLLRP